MTKILVTFLLASAFVACKEREPAVWLGMDRRVVACANIGETYPSDHKRCVGNGRLFECVFDGDHTWLCAEVKLASPSAEGSL